MPIIELKNLWWIPWPHLLCAKPYPNHPKGCPNLGKKVGCPPQAKVLNEYMSPPYFAIVNEFDLAKHVESLRSCHPQWSDRQLECCLYWQPRARKQLDRMIKEFLSKSLNVHFNMIVETCPEAHGIGVTKTLSEHGLELEWPPKKIVRQVAIAGICIDQNFKERIVQWEKK